MEAIPEQEQKMVQEIKPQRSQSCVRRIVKALLLIALISQAPMFIFGLISGVDFGEFVRARIDAGVEAFTADLDQEEFYDSISLPGLPCSSRGR